MPETQSVDTFLNEGARLLAEGHKNQALGQFEVATQLDPENEQAWMGVAKATDDVDQAIIALGEVLSLNPSNMQARNLRVSLQVSNIRKGLNATPQNERDIPVRQIVLTTLTVVALLVCVVIMLLTKDSLGTWLNEHFFMPSAQAASPHFAAAVFPATWTPQPTPTRTATPVPSNTPLPTATPSVVLGRINGTVNVRSGPGSVFSVIGTMNEPSPVVLVARNSANKFFQVHEPTDTRLLWVAMDFVDVTSGDVSILPEVDVPTPTPTKRPLPPAPPPPSPTSAPVYLFVQIKHEPNPYGPHCNKTLIQGTVWNQGYGNGYVPGTLVRVWVNGAVYGTDTAGSHPDSRPAFSGNRAYWEVDFPVNQPVSGLVAIVDTNGQVLSPQYPFTLTGGDCHSTTSINEIVIDFSH